MSAIKLSVFVESLGEVEFYSAERKQKYFIIYKTLRPKPPVFILTKLIKTLHPNPLCSCTTTLFLHLITITSGAYLKYNWCVCLLDPSLLILHAKLKK